MKVLWKGSSQIETASRERIKKIPERNRSDPEKEEGV